MGVCGHCEIKGHSQYFYYIDDKWLLSECILCVNEMMMNVAESQRYGMDKYRWIHGQGLSTGNIGAADTLVKHNCNIEEYMTDKN